MAVRLVKRHVSLLESHSMPSNNGYLATTALAFLLEEVS